MIRVRRIDVDDPVFDEARALDTIAAEVPPSADTEWYVAEVLGADLGPGTWVPVAIAGARIVETGAYFLSRACVDPAYRGQGIQKRLIRARVRRARKLGCPRVVTYTHPGNVASINSLIACGFRAAAQWHGDAWSHWSKQL